MIASVEPLTIGDLHSCLALAQDRHWPAEERKWRFLFAVGTVYGARDSTGDVIGTTVLTRFGTGLAAVSMVLVATRHERQGLGRRLMERVLSEAHGAVVFLNATELGRPLYEKVGFAPVGTTHTHIGTFAPARGAVRSRPALPADLPAIESLDAAVMGADRGALVRSLPGFCAHLRVVEDGGEITGYAGAWSNVANAVVGPVIAASAGDARALIADLARAVGGPVRVDLDERDTELRAWATKHGLAFRYSEPLMVLGGRPLPGDRSRWFSPLTQSIG